MPWFVIFLFNIQSVKDFQKGMKNNFFAGAVGSLCGEYIVFGAIKMVFLYTILIFFLLNQIVRNYV